MLPRASQLSKTSGSAGFHLPEEAERAKAILTEHLFQLSLPPGGLLETTGPFLGYVRIYPQRGRWCEKKKSIKREGNDLTIRGFQTALNWSQSWWYITRLLQNKGRKKKKSFFKFNFMQSYYLICLILTVILITLSYFQSIRLHMGA